MCKHPLIFSKYYLENTLHSWDNFRSHFSRTCLLDILYLWETKQSSFYSGDVVKETKKIFELPEDEETRVWNKFMHNTYEMITKLESTLQDSGISSGQVFLLNIMMLVNVTYLNAHNALFPDQLIRKILHNTEYGT